VPTSAVLAIGMGLFMLVQILIVAGWTPQTGTVWFAFGFFGTTGVLSYAVVTRVFPLHLSGRAVTAMNLIVFVAAFALQWGIGVVIDLWPATAAGGYHPHGYQAAFGLALALQGIAFAWLLHGLRALEASESEAR
jgi:hypothetical protein